LLAGCSEAFGSLDDGCFEAVLIQQDGQGGSSYSPR
jgi:hypothetical protein